MWSWATSIPTDTKDAYLSRVAAIDAGCPIETPAFNVNRLCGSGLQAIVSAAQAIALGDCDVAIGGGSESMSRGPYFDQAARWGARMGDARASTTCWASCTTPGKKCTWASRPRTWPSATSISREDAGPTGRAKPAPRRRRHRSRLLQGANRARGNCHAQRHRRVTTPMSTCAPATTLEDLARHEARLQEEGGTVTAGNASGINDGAAAGAGRRRPRGQPWASSPWPAWWATPTPGWTRLHGHWPRARHPEGAGAHRPEAGRTWT